MIVSVQVKPGSKKGPLVEPSADGTLIVYLKERAVDGAANQALIEVIAKHLGLPKRNITIKTGHSAKRKLLEVLN